MIWLQRGVSTDKPGKANRKPFMTPTTAQIPGHTIDGYAYFDQGAEFPCAAVFLDVEHALVLRKHEEREVYTRIGLVSMYSIDESSLQALQTIVIIK